MTLKYHPDNIYGIYLQNRASCNMPNQFINLREYHLCNLEALLWLKLFLFGSEFTAGYHGICNEPLAAGKLETVYLCHVIPRL